jgi:hypothetical protein
MTGSKEQAHLENQRQHAGRHGIAATTLPWRHKNLALPVKQFTGPDAPRSPHHAQAKSANGVKGSAGRCT